MLLLCLFFSAGRMNLITFCFLKQVSAFTEILCTKFLEISNLAIHFNLDIFWTLQSRQKQYLSLEVVLGQQAKIIVGYYHL